MSETVLSTQLKHLLFFSESRPQSEPCRFIRLCHERSLRARKGRHVNLTLFQFANLSSCFFSSFFFYRPSVLISSNNLFSAPVLQSCKCDPNMVFLPKLAAQEGFIFFSFPFLFCHKASFIFWPCCHHLDCRRRRQTMTMRMTMMLMPTWMSWRNKEAPPPSSDTTCWDFSFLFFSPRHILAGTMARSCTAGGLDQRRSALPRGRRANKAQCHGNRIKSTLKLISLQKAMNIVLIWSPFWGFSSPLLCFFCVLRVFFFCFVFDNPILHLSACGGGGGAGVGGEAIS